MSLSRKLSSRSASRPSEDVLIRPPSNLSVRSEGKSDNASQKDLKVPHKHNDYSCYIHVINKTESTFQLVDSKPISGHWANGTPPQKIEPDTDTLIELTDPKGPHGSEGWCTYRFQHPERSTPITFKLKFYDPYWTGHDNYLKASTRHPGLVSLNVLKYQTSGHPFIAYIEIKTLRNKNSSSSKNRKHSDEVTIGTSSDDGTLSLESPSESLPGYESRPVTASGPTKLSIINIHPVNADTDRGYLVDQKKNSIIVTVIPETQQNSDGEDSGKAEEKEEESVALNEDAIISMMPQVLYEGDEGHHDRDQQEHESLPQKAIEEDNEQEQELEEEKHEYEPDVKTKPVLAEANEDEKTNVEQENDAEHHDLTPEEHHKGFVQQEAETSFQRSSLEPIQESGPELDRESDDVLRKELVEEPVQHAQSAEKPEPAQQSFVEPVKEMIHESVVEPLQDPNSAKDQSSNEMPLRGPETERQSQLVEDDSEIEPVQESEPEPVIEPTHEPVHLPAEQSVEEPAHESGAGLDQSRNKTPVSQLEQPSQPALETPEIQSIQEPEPETQSDEYKEELKPLQDLTHSPIEDNIVLDSHNTDHTDTKKELLNDQMLRNTKESGSQTDDVVMPPVPPPTPTPQPVYTDKETQTQVQLEVESSINPSSEDESELKRAAMIEDEQMKTALDEDSMPQVPLPVSGPIQVHREAHIPNIIQEASTIISKVTTTIFKTHHGRLGIMALVFLTSYGVTAARVSRGLMIGGGRRS